jgi:CRISPR-associated protein Cas2
MFDLPTDTKSARKQYSQFRKFLLNDGYDIMQYSIYSRHHAREENAQVHIQRVKERLPPDGEVRIVKITDKQFGRIEIFFGKISQPVQVPPEQLEFF